MSTDKAAVEARIQESIAFLSNALREGGWQLKRPVELVRYGDAAPRAHFVRAANADMAPGVGGAPQPIPAPAGDEAEPDLDDFERIRGKVKRVQCLRDEETGSREWMAYKIIIETNEGTWHITGNHDQGPDCQPIPRTIDRLASIGTVKESGNVYICARQGCRSGHVLPAPGLCGPCRLYKFGEKLREVRLAGEKTLGQMARHLGLTTVDASSAESGKRFLSSNYLKMWLEFSGAMSPELLAELSELSR